MCNYAGIIRDKIDLLNGAERTVMLNVLVNCAYADHDVVYEGKNITLKCGQWITTTRKLAELTGLTHRQVRTVLKNMTQFSTQPMTQRATLITVANIERWLHLSKTATHAPTQYPTQSQESPYIGIYSLYKEKIQKGAQLTTASKEKIKLRLKEFTEAELLAAIENFSKDQWWMENNAHRGIPWFFNSQDRVLGFINMKPRIAASPAPKPITYLYDIPIGGQDGST